MLIEKNRLPAAKVSAVSLFTPLLLLTGVIGVALILYCTRWGAGLVDDSFIYITSARNLVAGHGLSWPWGSGELLPMVSYPPMFPFTLAAFEVIGISALTAARLVNAFAFGANLLLTGWIARYAARSWGFALLAVLLFLSSDVLIETHAWALSEPLYLFFTVSGLLGLVIYFERQNRSALYAAAILLGLGFLTRYIGFSLLLTGAFTLVLVSDAPWRRRWVDLAWFAALSSLPMAGWMARSYLLIGSAIDRPMQSYLVTLNQLRRGLGTLLTWFLPGRLVNGRETSLLALLLLALAAAIAAAVFLRRADRPPAGSPGQVSSAARWVLGAQAFFHIAVLLVSKSFFEETTPLSDRILSPILPSLLILSVSLLSDLWRTERAPIRLAAAAFSVLFLGLYISRAAGLFPRLHGTGLGFARKGWHNSQTLQAVRELPPVPLFSNSPAAIYMWTGRPAYPIYEVSLLRQSVQENRAVLVLFNSVSLDLYDVSQEELTQGLAPTATYKDGVIYRAAPD